MTRAADTPAAPCAGSAAESWREAGSGVRVTGCGILLPWGRGTRALEAGGGRMGAAGKIADFNPREHIQNAKALRAMPRGFQLTAAAARLALQAAGIAARPEGLAEAGLAAERAGVVIAAADLNPVTPDLVALLAERQTGEAFGEAALHQLHPFRRLHLLTNLAAAHISILFGFQGPSLTLTSGPAAAAQALEEGAALLREGRAEAVLCAACDCPEQTLALGPEETGEGEAAAAILMERAEAAEGRGASGARLQTGRAEAWMERFPVCGALLAAAAASTRPAGANPPGGTAEAR